ncbi:phage tail sheath family protein [Modestobacter excelsi]|uniref:phage tail sheath family protein n=1 Tax=Modestobacter excelsi TaxID=2213161 RepID=UPI00110CCCDC|nr:phage tail sheath C-terminal domain-containing protein [Modestobacter excelsi]
MPEYLSPGVYVEEIDAGPRPIAGVSTTTTGMVGVTVRGPVDGKPRLVTNFLEYQRTFGGFLPQPDVGLAARWTNDPVEGGIWWRLAHSVQGFFVNGGQRLYVKRVAAGGAAASSGSMGRGRFARITADAATGAATLQISDLLGLGGNGTAVTLVRGTDGTEMLSTTIASYDSTGPSITLATALREEVRAGRGDVVRVGGVVQDPNTAANRTVRFGAASPGGWGDSVQVRVEPVASATLRLLPDPSEGALFVTRLAQDAAANSPTLVVEATTGLAATQDDSWVLAGQFRLPVDHIDPVAGDATQFTLTLATGTNHPGWRTGFGVRRVRRVNPDPTARTIRVASASRLYREAQLQIDDGSRLLLRSVAGEAADDVVTLNEAPGGDPLFETDRLSLVEATVLARFTDETGDLVEESLGPIRLTAAAEQPESIESVLAASSQLVRAARGAALSGDPSRFPVDVRGGWLSLADGDDNFDSLDTGDFVGTDGGSGRRTGIVALEDIDEIAICAVPSVWSGTVQSSLITHCESLKDRFAVLDPQDGLSIEGVRQFREAYDTRYAALYHPWLVIPDPSGRGPALHVGPSGHMAGIYARTDIERGVHKAPANSVVRGVRVRDGFAQDISKREQDVLNPKGINALRFFPGFGHRVWGARTLSSDSSWKYVNVRRLFIYLEESIDEGTQWAVFEPNDEALWALVKQTVSNFLTTTWRSGALAGTTPDEAFFVACDRTTMTEDDLQNGRLICVIGVAPVFPAEFVIFRIQQKTREAQLV